MVGLDEIMAELYSKGRQANQVTAHEMLSRLEDKNYIPSSEITRREYRHLLLEQYKEYRSARAAAEPR